jgi:hypothetical protein
LTDSIFDALLACFDETMDCIGGYKAWRSYNTVGIMQEQLLMSL